MTASLYSYSLPTNIPSLPIREGLLLEYDGGWGEIAPLPGRSRETLLEAKEEILRCLPNLSKTTPIYPSVRFGIESASRPLRSIRVPLSLFNRPRPGFTTLKLKLGHLSIDDAIALVQSLFKTYRLRLDCNQAWTLDEALYFVSHFSPQDFDYLEEPVPSSDLIRFSTLTGFPIAVDESYFYRDPLGFVNFGGPQSGSDFDDREESHIAAIWPTKDRQKMGRSDGRKNSQNLTGRGGIYELPNLKAVIIKPTCTGFVPKLPVPIVLSSSYESSLGLLQIGSLASQLPVGLDTFGLFLQDLLVPPLKAENGYLTWSPTHAHPIDKTKLCLIAAL